MTELTATFRNFANAAKEIPLINPILHNRLSRKSGPTGQNDENRSQQQAVFITSSQQSHGHVVSSQQSHGQGVSN